MFRRSTVLLGVGAIGAFICVVLAQSQEGKAPSQSEMKKQFAEMAEKASAPTEEHKRLAALVGEFDQTVEVRMGPGEPLTSHVRATGEWLMGGRFVQIKADLRPMRSCRASG